MNSALRIVLAILLLAVTPVRAAEPMPIRDFVRDLDLLDAKISPNGDYLAISKWLGDSVGLAVYDLKAKKFINTFKLTRGQSIVRYAWDPLESTCRHASLSIL